MDQKVDRRVRKTKAQLRAGLAKLMQDKSIQEITVKELVDEVDINRSTFYLHYTDIYNMLDQIEAELLAEIISVIDAHKMAPIEDAFPFIADIFTILENNKDICRALIGPNGDLSFVNGIEHIISSYSMQALSPLFPQGLQEDLRYSSAFWLSGCMGLIKSWLLNNRPDSPEHMASLTYQMVMNVVNTFPKQPTA